MKVVIHVGMHKTGSSAIQNHFAEHSYGGLEYAPWSSPNHCGLFILLRSKWQSALDQQMVRLKGTDTTLLFSAEDISHPEFDRARTNLWHYFAERADEVRVVGYVRPPLSFTRSAFQEMLKGSDLRTFDINALWPAYRARFEPLDDIFGRSNVKLKLYTRDALHRGNVVADFGRELGIDVVPSAMEANDNESLSAEATALLYMQRRLGSGFLSGVRRAYLFNERFISDLRRIGHQRLTFSPEAWNPVVDAHASDLAWMEQRLGLSLAEPATDDGLPIGSEEDLLAIAEAQTAQLEQILIERIQNLQLQGQGKTALMLELLQKSGHF